MTKDSNRLFVISEDRLHLAYLLKWFLHFIVADYRKCKPAVFSLCVFGRWGKWEILREVDFLGQSFNNSLSIETKLKNKRIFVDDKKAFWWRQSIYNISINLHLSLLEIKHLLISFYLCYIDSFYFKWKVMFLVWME